MPLIDPSHWSDEFRRVLSCYDEALLRQVATKLVKPRSQWPVDELIDRCSGRHRQRPRPRPPHQGTGAGQRQLLALIGHSRQPLWNLGNLVELVIALGSDDGLTPILHLCEAGLLCPLLPESVKRLKSIEQWLGQAGTVGLKVFAHPAITERSIGEDLELPALVTPHGAAAPQEADGLEWPLRLCVLWQQVGAGPLRRTQQGEFFKRDLERLTDEAAAGRRGRGSAGRVARPGPARRRPGGDRRYHRGSAKASCASASCRPPGTRACPPRWRRSGRPCPTWKPGPRSKAGAARQRPRQPVSVRRPARRDAAVPAGRRRLGRPRRPGSLGLRDIIPTGRANRFGRRSARAGSARSCSGWPISSA